MSVVKILLVAALAHIGCSISIQWKRRKEPLKSDIEIVNENWATAVRRAQEHVKTLSLEDKIALLHGQEDDMDYVGYVNSKKHYTLATDNVRHRDTEHHEKPEKATSHRQDFPYEKIKPDKAKSEHHEKTEGSKSDKEKLEHHAKASESSKSDKEKSEHHEKSSSKSDKEKSEHHEKSSVVRHHGNDHAAHGIAVSSMDLPELEKTNLELATESKQVETSSFLEFPLAIEKQQNGTISQEPIELCMQDGGQGFRTFGDHTPITATQFPGLLGVAATFNTESAKSYGEVLADEFVNKGANVLLGPELDIARVPNSGRTFESLAGEDPFLGATLVKPYVKAVQSRGVITVLKHFLNNNQENGRHSMNVEVSDRTQHELYLPPFKAGIEAGAGGVMCSYNQVYGYHACENKKLLKDILRDTLGFKGFVISDWGATENGTTSAKNGLDIEMAGSHNSKYKFTGLKTLLANGEVAQEDIDSMAVHVLSAMYAAGQFDGKPPRRKKIHANVRKAQHMEVAKAVAIDGAVLLKNDGGVLPLTPEGKKIAFIGTHCNWKPGHETWKGPSGNVYQGGGSGYVRAMPVTPLQAVKKKWKNSTIVSSEDAAAARGADLAIICTGAHGAEGDDREGIAFADAQVLAQDARMKIGDGKVIMLAMAPGMFTTEWMDQVDATLLMFVPGEQVGPAAVDLLDGTANPAGRLPLSLPKLAENRFSPQQWPGIADPTNKIVHHKTLMTQSYSEGSLVGYRMYDAKGVKPAFPFGFGLSYTEFKIGPRLKLSTGEGTAKVSVIVKNIGQREGAAVPQLYVGFPSMQPTLRKLRGFQKVVLAPGQQRWVDFFLTAEDWSFYDEASRGWKSALEMGEDITISVGPSSATLPLKTVIKAPPSGERLIK